MGFNSCFCFLIAFYSAAQFASANAEEWKLQTHGDLSFIHSQYLTPLEPSNTILETLRAKGDLNLKYGKEVRFKFTPLMQADPLNHSARERYWADLPAGYVQVQDQDLTLSVGFNTVQWGVTDGYNPLDVVNARRLQDPLNSEKLGAFSVQAKKSFGDLVFEGIYIPWQRKSILPGESSRWLPREVFTTATFTRGSEAATLNLPHDLNYSYGGDSERDRALLNNVGFRVLYSNFMPGLDLTAQVFNGAATTPSIDVVATGVVTQVLPAIVIDAKPNVTLIPVFYRQWVYGGSFVYSHFGMIFKGEVAITRLISKGSDLLGDSEEYVFGIERPLSIFTRELTVLLQGTLARHTEPINNSTLSLSRLFDRALIFGLRFSVSEKLLSQASALYDTESKGALFHLDFSLAATDSLKLALAGDSLTGAASTPIGTYRKNNRIIASIKVAF